MSCETCEYARKAGNPDWVACSRLSNVDVLMHAMRDHLHQQAEEGARVPLLVREPDCMEDMVNIINMCLGYTGNLATGWAYSVRPESEAAGMMYNEQFVVERNAICGLYEPRFKR